MFKAIQCVHAFTGAPRPFFIPAFSAGLWFFAVEELLTQFTHMIAVLYVIKLGSRQFKFIAVVVNNFVIG
jgi:hypothetical protein